jgi:TrmH family RNA methyltransferase
MTREEILQIKSLSKRSERQKRGLFIVEGVKNIVELASSPIRLERIYYKQGMEEHIPEQLMPSSTAVSSKEMERFSQMKTPPGILAVAQIPSQDSNHLLHQLSKQKLPFALVADGIQDPGNLGTLIRSAEWFGLNAVFVTENTTDPWSTKCVQASMGSIFKVPVLNWTSDSISAAEPLRHFAMDLDGTSYDAVSWSPGLIWIGSESHGLHEARQIEHEKITIPRFGRAESLNAGVAGSIACAEVARSYTRISTTE